jgi:hypothetical protein
MTHLGLKPRLIAANRTANDATCAGTTVRHNRRRSIGVGANRRGFCPDLGAISILSLPDDTIWFALFFRVWTLALALSAGATLLARFRAGRRAPTWSQMVQKLNLSERVILRMAPAFTTRPKLVAFTTV